MQETTRPQAGNHETTGEHASCKILTGSRSVDCHASMLVAFRSNSKLEHAEAKVRPMLEWAWDYDCTTEAPVASASWESYPEFSVVLPKLPIVSIVVPFFG